MDVTRIIAMRHGETAWNVDTRIQGHLDIPLNDTGQWQARQLARALADEPVASDHLHQRPAARPGHRPRPWPTCHRRTPGGRARALRERSFGHFQGRTFAEIEAELPERGPALAPARPALRSRGRRVADRTARAHQRHGAPPGCAPPRRADRAGGAWRRARRALPPGHRPGAAGAAHLATGQRRHQPPAVDAGRPEHWSAGPTPCTWTTQPAMKPLPDHTCLQAAGVQHHRPSVSTAIDTPALVIDLDAMERNMARMAAFARKHHVRLRPHAKMHKSAANSHGCSCSAAGGGRVRAEDLGGRGAGRGGVSDIYHHQPGHRRPSCCAWPRWRSACRRRAGGWRWRWTAWRASPGSRLAVESHGPPPPQAR
jgi:hypothetical protein